MAKKSQGSHLVSRTRWLAITGLVLSADYLRDRTLATVSQANHLAGQPGRARQQPADDAAAVDAEQVSQANRQKGPRGQSCAPIAVPDEGHLL